MSIRMLAEEFIGRLIRTETAEIFSEHGVRKVRVILDA